MNSHFIALVIWLAGCGFASADPIDDVLSVLALTRDELGIRKAYLPDPDRLPVQLSIMADPAGGPSWLETLSDSLIKADAEDVLGLVGRLVEAPVVTQDSCEVGLLGAVEQIGHRLSGMRDTTTTLIGLVHPDSSWRYPRVSEALMKGRRVRLASLFQHLSVLVAATANLPDTGEPRVIETPAGRVAIGSSGADVYEGPYALIVDPGGDDHYVDAAGVSSPGMPVSVAIDLAGNDRYSGRAGVGVSGVGLLVDLAGHDAYSGGDASFGVGIGGVGVLIDRSGNDRYASGVGAQGFGLYGIGILIDDDGDDTYRCSFLGQGSSGPGGFGLLLDRTGGDRYFAGEVYPDFREPQHYQSMSQGFSLGMQTEASGGVGLLVDGAGDDHYEVSYFGQGASHWAGLGALYDGGGNDRYTARRYAQGCGVHLAAGLLVDRSGDDVYSMWGVGQGIGHDLAVGVLSDRGGDDRYRIEWLGQGAGNANGIGMLLDAFGDDDYSAVREDTQGHGIAARDYGSIGILVDGAGKDVYRSYNARKLVLSGSQGARLDQGGAGQ